MLTLSFIFSCLAPYPGHCFALAKEVAPSLQTPSFSLDDLVAHSFPYEIGAIDEVYRGSSSKTIVLIQDAHTHPEAQASIEKIIEYLSSRYTLPAVAMEGGSGPLDSRLFRAFPYPEAARKVFDPYLARGEISGAAMAAIFNPRNIPFYGLENQQLYQKNIEFFLRALTKNGEIKSNLTRTEKEINAAKLKFYPQKLLVLDQKLQSMEDEEFTIFELLPELARIKEPGLRYPSVNLVLKELKKAPAFDSHLVRKEIASFRRSVRTHLVAPEEVRQFNERHQAYNTGKIDALDFASFLDAVNKRGGVGFRPSASVSAMLRNRELFRKIKAADFMKDWKQYVNEIQSVLLDSDRARAIDQEARQLKLVKKLIAFEMNHEEWQSFRKNPPPPAREFPFQDHLGFYETAEKRSAAFFENLSRLMNTKHLSVLAFLVGGFHTQTLAGKFKESGISYVIISPCIRSHPDKDLYFKIMTGQVSWRDHLKVKNGSVDLYEAFAEAATEKLAKTVGRAALKEWRSRMIRLLAGNGKIETAGRYTRFIDRAAIQLLEPGDSKALQEKWQKKLEAFIAGLKKLAQEDPLTERRVAKLFSEPATVPIFANPVFHTKLSGKLYALLLGSEDATPAEFGPRSEVRSLEPPANQILEPEALNQPETIRALKSLRDSLMNRFLYTPEELLLTQTVVLEKNMGQRAAYRIKKTEQGESLELVLDRDWLEKAHQEAGALGSFFVHEVETVLYQMLVRSHLERPDGPQNLSLLKPLAIRHQVRKFMEQDWTVRNQELEYLDKNPNLLDAHKVSAVLRMASGKMEAWEKEAEDPHQKLKPTFSDREEKIQKIVDELTLEAGPAHDLTPSSETNEWLKQVQTLEQAAEKAHIERQVETFKQEGEYTRSKREFWQNASLAFQRRLVEDLVQRIRASKGKDRFKLHELLTQDLTGIPVYEGTPYKLQGLFDSYNDAFSRHYQGKDPEGQRRIKFFLEQLFSGEAYTQDLGFSIRNRMWEWKSEDVTEEDRLTAVARFMDFLTGIPGQRRGHRWTPSGDFEEVDPRRLVDVLAENVFRSSWIDEQGGRERYSDAVYHYLGFRTGGITTGMPSRNDFYQLVERASVIRSFQYFEATLKEVFPRLQEEIEAFGVSSFQELEWKDQTKIADKILASPLLEDEDLRDSLGILRREDLTTRAFAGVVKGHLEAVYSWRAFLEAVLSKIRDVRKSQAAGREFKKEFKDDSGRPILSLIGKKSVSGFITYEREDTGKIIFEDEWKLGRPLPFEDSKSKSEWEGQGALKQRTFLDEQGKEELRIIINPQGMISAIESFEDSKDGGRRMKRHEILERNQAFESAKDWTLADWLNRRGSFVTDQREEPEQIAQEWNFEEDSKGEVTKPPLRVYARMRGKIKMVTGVARLGYSKELGDYEDRHQLFENNFKFVRTRREKFEELDGAEEGVFLYNSKVITRRTFSEIDQDAGGQERERPVLDVELDPAAQKVTKIKRYAYGPERQKLWEDELEISDPNLFFDKRLTADEYGIVAEKVKKRTFTDAAGRPLLVINLKDGDIQSVEGYLEHRGFFRYSSSALPRERKFNVSWDLEEWLHALGPLVYSSEIESSEDENIRKVEKVEEEYQAAVHLIQEAVPFFERYEFFEEGFPLKAIDTRALEALVRNILDPALYALMGIPAPSPEPAHELLKRYSELTSFGLRYPEASDLNDEEMEIILELHDGLPQKELPPVYLRPIRPHDFTPENVEKSARAVLKTQGVLRSEVRADPKDLEQTLGRMNPPAGKIEAVLGHLERYLRKMGAKKEDLPIGITQMVRANKSTAWQSALAISEILQADDEEESFGLKGAKILDAGGLFYAALREKGYSREELSNVRDYQPDEILRKVRRDERTEWNPNLIGLEEAPDWESLAEKPEHQGRYDLVTSIFDLNLETGIHGQEAVVDFLKTAHRLLKPPRENGEENGQKPGRLVITLSATHGFESDAIRQIEGLGYKKIKEGLAYNHFTSKTWNQLLDNDISQREAMEVENEIKHRQFYVLILEAAGPPAPRAGADRIRISTYPAPQIPVDDEPPSKETVIKSPAERDKVLKEIRAGNLETSPLFPRSEEAKRERTYTHRRGEVYETLMKDEREKLRLIHKYRLWLLGKPPGETESYRIKDPATRRQVAELLNRTYAKPRMKNPEYLREDEALQFWNEAEDPNTWEANQIDPWFFGEEEGYENRIVLKDPSGRPRFTIFYRKTKEPGQAELVRVYVHPAEGEAEPRLMKRPFSEINGTVESVGEGKILVRSASGKTKREYKIPKGLALVAKPGDSVKAGQSLSETPPEFLFDPDQPGDLNHWESLEGKVYLKSIDLKAGRRIHERIEKALKLLQEHYYHPNDKSELNKRIFKAFPRFDSWFKDETAELIWTLREDENAFPFPEIRALIPRIFHAWKNREPISFKDAETFRDVRRMVRQFKDAYQALGRRFRRGGAGTWMKEKMEKSREMEAARHKNFLFGNPSFFSAVAAVPLLKKKLEESGGKLVLLDDAAGTGALVWAMERWGVPRPDGKNFIMIESDLDRNFLSQPRPENYGTIWRIQADAARRPFPDQFLDLKTGFFILDFLPPDKALDMFLEDNRQLKIGGEALYTFPKSWQPAPEFIGTLKELGFDVTMPSRRRQSVNPAFLERIKDHYRRLGRDDYGREIAQQVKRMREKEFMVLRIRKNRHLSEEERRELKNTLDPKLSFDLMKTETDQRGASTGEKPFDYSPEAMMKWAEVLKWLLEKWYAQDIEVEDPDQNMALTRRQVLEKFPEIETGDALEHLYRFRHMFPANGGMNDYALIFNFHIYWNSQADYFLPSDVERLIKLYKRGPPRGETPFDFMSVDEAVERIKRRAESQMNTVKGKKTAAAERLRKSAEEATQFADQIRENFEAFKALHPKYSLLWSQDDPHREYFNLLHPKGSNERAFSVQRLAWIEKILEHHKKFPGNDLLLKRMDTTSEEPQEPEPVESAPAAPPAQPEGPAVTPAPPAGAAVPSAPDPAGLQTDAVQKDLYAIYQRAYAIYQRAMEGGYDTTAQLIGGAPKFSAGLVQHPVLRPFFLQGLTPQNPLTQQIELQHSRAEYLRTLEEAYRTLGALVMRFSDQKSLFVYNLLLPVKDPWGGTQNLILDLAQTDLNPAGDTIEIKRVVEFQRGLIPNGFEDNPQRGYLDRLETLLERVAQLGQSSAKPFLSIKGLTFHLDTQFEIYELAPHSQNYQVEQFPGLPTTEKRVQFLNLETAIQALFRAESLSRPMRILIQGVYDYLRQISLAPIDSRTQDELKKEIERMKFATDYLRIQAFVLNDLVKKGQVNKESFAGWLKNADFEDTLIPFLTGQKDLRSPAFEDSSIKKLLEEARKDHPEALYLISIPEEKKPSRLRIIAKDRRRITEPVLDLSEPFKQSGPAARSELRAGEPDGISPELARRIWRANQNELIQLWRMSAEERSTIHHLLLEILRTKSPAEPMERLKTYVARLSNTENRKAQTTLLLWPAVYETTLALGRTHITRPLIEPLYRLVIDEMSQVQVPDSKLFQALQQIEEMIADERIPLSGRIELQMVSETFYTRLERAYGTPQKPFYQLWNERITNKKLGWFQRRLIRKGPPPDPQQLTDIYHWVKEFFGNPNQPMKDEKLREIDTQIKQPASAGLRLGVVGALSYPEFKNRPELKPAAEKILQEIVPFMSLEDIFDALIFAAPHASPLFLASSQPLVVAANRLLEDPKNQSAFAEILRRHEGAYRLWATLFIANVRLMPLDETNENTGHIAKTILTNVAGEDPLPAFSSYKLVVSYLKSLQEARESLKASAGPDVIALFDQQITQTAAWFLDRTTYTLMEKYGLDLERYYGLLTVGLNAFTDPQFRKEFILVVARTAEEIFKKGLEDGDLKKLKYKSAEAWLHLAAVFSNFSSDEILGIDTNGKTRFERILAARLAESEVQKDLYAVVGNLIQYYEQTDRSKILEAIQEPMAAFKAKAFHFPEIDDVLTILKGPGYVPPHPLLQGADLSEDSPLYDALRLAYLRHQARRTLQDTYRALGQMVANAATSTEQNLRFDLLLRTKHGIYRFDTARFNQQGRLFAASIHDLGFTKLPFEDKETAAVDRLFKLMAGFQFLMSHRGDWLDKIPAVSPVGYGSGILIPEWDYFEKTAMKLYTHPEFRKYTDLANTEFPPPIAQTFIPLLEEIQNIKDIQNNLRSAVQGLATLEEPVKLQELIHQWKAIRDMLHLYISPPVGADLYSTPRVLVTHIVGASRGEPEALRNVSDILQAPDSQTALTTWEERDFPLQDLAKIERSAPELYEDFSFMTELANASEKIELWRMTDEERTVIRGFIQRILAAPDAQRRHEEGGRLGRYLAIRNEESRVRQTIVEFIRQAALGDYSPDSVRESYAAIKTALKTPLEGKLHSPMEAIQLYEEFMRDPSIEVQDRIPSITRNVTVSYVMQHPDIFSRFQLKNSKLLRYQPAGPLKEARFGTLDSLDQVLRTPEGQKEFIAAVRTLPLLWGELSLDLHRNPNKFLSDYPNLGTFFREAAAGEDPEIAVFSFSKLIESWRKAQDPPITGHKLKAEEKLLKGVVFSLFDRYGFETEHYYGMLHAMASDIMPKVGSKGPVRHFDTGDFHKFFMEPAKQMMDARRHEDPAGTGRQKVERLLLTVAALSGASEKELAGIKTGFGLRSEVRAAIADPFNDDQYKIMLEKSELERTFQAAITDPALKGEVPSMLARLVRKAKKIYAEPEKQKLILENLMELARTLKIEEAFKQKLAARPTASTTAVTPPVPTQPQTALPPHIAEAFKTADENRGKTLWHMTTDERLHIRELVFAVLKAKDSKARAVQSQKLMEYASSENQLSRFFQTAVTLQDENRREDYPLPLLQEIELIFQDLKIKIMGPLNRAGETPAELVREVQLHFEALRDPALSESETAILLDTGAFISSRLRRVFSQGGLNPDKGIDSYTKNDKVAWWFSQGKSPLPALEEIFHEAQEKAASQNFPVTDIKRMLNRLDEFLRTDEGKSAFNQRLLSGYFAERPLSFLLTKALTQGISLGDYPHLKNHLMESSQSEDIELATAINIAIHSMAGAEILKTSNAHQAWAFAKELLLKRMERQGGDELAITLILGLSCQSQPMGERSLKEVLEAAFMQGLREGDPARIRYHWLRRVSNFALSFGHLNPSTANEILGLDRQNQTRFEQILNKKISDEERRHWAIPREQITWRDRYEAILKREREKLASPEMQKDLYAIMGRAIRDYEKLHFHFPEDFEAILPILRMPGAYDFIPSLKGRELANPSPLYEAVELAYLRHKYLETQRFFYAGLGKMTLGTLSEMQQRILILNSRIKIKHPAGHGIQILIADGIEKRDKEDDPKRVYFFPVAPISDMPFTDNHQKDFLEGVKAWLAVAARLQKDPNALVDGINLRNAEFIVVFHDLENTPVNLEALPSALKSQIRFTTLEELIQPLAVSNIPKYQRRAEESTRLLKSIRTDLKQFGLWDRDRLLMEMSGNLLAIPKILYWDPKEAENVERNFFINTPVEIYHSMLRTLAAVHAPADKTTAQLEAEINEALGIDPQDPDRLTHLDRIAADGERAKYPLSDPVIRKDLYRIIEGAVEEYEDEHFLFPDWKSVLALLEQPGRLNFHPALRGLKLLPETEAYQTFEKHYDLLRRQMAVFQARRALNQYRAFLSRPEGQWEFDVEIRIPDASKKDGFRHYRADAMLIEDHEIRHMIFSLEGFYPSPYQDQLESRFAASVVGLEHLFEELKRGKIKIGDRTVSPEATHRVSWGPLEAGFLKGTAAWDFLQAKPPFPVPESFGGHLQKISAALDHEILNPTVPTNLLFILGGYLKSTAEVMKQDARFKEAIKSRQFTPYSGITSTVNVPPDPGNREIFLAPLADLALAFTGDPESKMVFNLEEIQRLYSHPLGSSFKTFYDRATGDHQLFNSTEKMAWEKSWKPPEETPAAAVDIANAHAPIRLWQMTGLEESVLKKLIRDLLKAPDEEQRMISFKRLGAYTNLRNSLSRKFHLGILFIEEALLGSYGFEAIRESNREMMKRLILKDLSQCFNYLQLTTEFLNSPASFDRKVFAARGAFMLFFYGLSRVTDSKMLDKISQIKNSKIIWYAGRDIDAVFVNAERLEDLLQRPEGYGKFAEAIHARHFWLLGGLTDSLLKNPGRSLLDFPKIKEAFARMIHSQDAVLSFGAFDHLAGYWTRLKEMNSKNMKPVKDFMDANLADMIRQHGFQVDNYRGMVSSILFGNDGFFEVVVKTAEEVFREGLEKRDIQKLPYQRIIRLISSTAAMLDKTAGERDRILKVDKQGRNLFDRILDEGSNREKYDEIMKVPEVRSELRTEVKALEIAALEARESGFASVLKNTAAYLFADEVPPRSEIRRLIETINHFGLEKVKRAFEQWFRAMTHDPALFAAEVLRVESLSAFEAQAFEEALDRGQKKLRTLGLQFDQKTAADLVFILDRKPDINLLVSLLKSEPALNLLVVRLPEEGFEGTNSRLLRKTADEAGRLEGRVHQLVSSDTKGGRFEIVVPANERKALRLLQEAAVTLFNLRPPGKSAPSVKTLQDRMVYIYPRGLRNLTRYKDSFLPGTQSVEHRLASKDQNLYGKEYLLLKGAAEISQDTLSALMKALFHGDRHYSFDDSKASTEILLALAQMKTEFERKVAASA